MELRRIYGENFIVQRDGKKENIQTPSEAKQAEQKEIEESNARIGTLDNALGIIRQRMEVELIDGIDTRASRCEIAVIEEEIDDFLSDIRDAERRIKQVDTLIDQHAAEAIRQADAEHLAALTAPHDQIIKEFAL